MLGAGATTSDCQSRAYPALVTCSTYLNVGEGALYSMCWWASGLALIGVYYPQVDWALGQHRAQPVVGQNDLCRTVCAPQQVGPLWSHILLPQLKPCAPHSTAFCPAVLAQADHRLPGGRPAHGPGFWLPDLLAPAPHVARGHALRALDAAAATPRGPQVSVGQGVGVVAAVAAAVHSTVCIASAHLVAVQLGVLLTCMRAVTCSLQVP